MTNTVCDNCGRRIKDIRGVIGSDIADGMFFCSKDCRDEYEDEYYEQVLVCPNCKAFESSPPSIDVFRKFDAENEGDEDRIFYTCTRCFTTGVKKKLEEV